MAGNEKICELLLFKMSQETINSVNTGGKTASELAKTKGYNKIVELITTRLTQIQQEKQQAELEAKKQVELEAKQKQEQEEIQQFNELISAIQNNKLEDAEDLIRSSNIQTLSKIDENGNTILHYVAEKKYTETIQITC